MRLRGCYTSVAILLLLFCLVPPFLASGPVTSIQKAVSSLEK
jgi:hypothetical protein